MRVDGFLPACALMLALAVAVLPACGGGNGSGSGTGVADGSNAAPDPSTLVLTVTARPVKTLAFDWPEQPGAQSYRLLQDIDGEAGPAGETLLIDLPAGVTHHETEVFLPERVTARYQVQACGVSGCAGSAWAVPGSLVPAIGYFKASNTAASAEFGQSVALSANGHTMAVGTYLESGVGAVYVYVKGASGWVQQAYLRPFDPDQGDEFAYSLALSANGDRLAVGAAGDDSARNGHQGVPADNSQADSGVVYTYDRNSAGEWLAGERLKGWHARPGDQAGYAVALSADGRTLAMGAHAEDNEAGGINPTPTHGGSAEYSGAVYVFIHDGLQWQPQAYLKAEVPGQDDLFGSALSLSASGDSLLVAAPRESGGLPGVNSLQSDNSAPDAGAAYVFVRDAAGQWRQQAYLKPPVVRSHDRFGRAVQLAANGLTVVVGADREGGTSVGVNGDPSALGLPDAGAAHVFVLSGAGWTHQAYLKPPRVMAGQSFGQSLALSSDGQMLAVGAYDHSSATGFDGDMADGGAMNSGAAFMFRRTAQGTWSHSTYLKAPNTHADAYMGWSSMAFSANGQALAIGVSGDYSAATGVQGDQTDRSARWSGAALLY
ncbi:integrin [Hydrogenophaga sp. XSHU_21]